MTDGNAGEVTSLLLAWQAGRKDALDALMPLVYEELRRVAQARLRAERGNHSLQTTALVHEVYLRLVDVNRVSFESRTHFLAVAARLMRQIVVDHARRRLAHKRGAGAMTIALDEQVDAAGPNIVDVLAVDRALDDLARLHERLGRIVELRFFAGLTIEEAATALDVSPATVERDWAFAKAWLYERLKK